MVIVGITGPIVERVVEVVPVTGVVDIFESVDVLGFVGVFGSAVVGVFETVVVPAVVEGVGYVEI